MSTFVIRVKSGVSQTTLNDRFRVDPSRAPDAVARLSGWLHALAGGLESASISVQSGSADPVASSQTLTVSYALLLAAATVTIAGNILTCTTGTPATAEFKKEVDGPTSAVNLAAAINAHATLSQLVSASASAGVVTVSANAPGIIGNLVTVVSSATGVVAGGAVLAGGAGGATNAPVTYSRGL